MRLRLFTPGSSLSVLQEDLDLVVHFQPGPIADVYVPKGRPTPDRHYILGLVQSSVTAIREEDEEMVVRVEAGSARLLNGNDQRTFSAGLIMVRSADGLFGTAVFGDRATVRMLSREALRYFTGTIRLDVP
ncbi:MAG: hypothetical protein V2B18_18430 [Pseudomonadota bacterium]